MTTEEKEMMEASEKAHKEIDAILQKHIGKMFGSLEAASIKYFLETGRINGSFRLNLVRMMFSVEVPIAEAIRKYLDEKGVKETGAQDVCIKMIMGYINTMVEPT